MSNKTILKEAGVLFIVVVIGLSSVAAMANTLEQDPLKANGAVLEIEVRNGFGSNLLVILRNIGDEDAYDVNWSTDITLNFFVIRFIDDHFDDVIERLPAGNETQLTSTPIFGLGHLEIQAVATASNADSVSKIANGFVLGPFILGMP